MTLGEKIKKLRQLRKWTQKELGEHSGISEATIRKYELGLRNPKTAQINKIAEALGVQPSALLDDDMIKAEYSTVADIMTLLITLDNVVGLSFEGSRDDEGCLAPETMSIRINNPKVNKVFADWELVRKQYLEAKQISYKQATASLCKGSQNLDIHDLLNVINCDPLQKNKEAVDLSIIANCRIPLDDDDAQ